ncbi:hypothetical protein A2153_02410 [Candidatus Gottesmanbacteria bacterium RBG_16_38_7b]|uniref:GHMP kinase N-terminal domain-containing protein n=1 Tax=Candidatus Gottesmanbacteria bacterium RBG_16_38_7b TaxID=1798372 RepID=A0A1F5YK73_9BACT|nr:MAG: hypothetical protein A2153_02410 [Candidatus Gottesmanbacteria bacterium RBG_16_38_7b]
MESVTANCPASLSFIFKAFIPESMQVHKMNSEALLSFYRCYGSTGVGCTIDKKVRVKVSTSLRKRLTFNGKNLRIPTVWRAVCQLTKNPLEINISSPLPLGCGFGISGAATLATLAAVARLFKLKISRQELILIAHKAEIEEKTGLGTIATQVTGGFLVKKKPGIPPRFRRLRLTGAKIYAVRLGKMITSEVLKNKNKIKRINYYADKAMTEINSLTNPTLGKIIDISFEFWRRSKIFNSPESERLIKIIRKQNGSATMAIIGKVVLSNIKPVIPKKYNIEELIISEERMSGL